jgi:hypothetical protein
VKGLAVNKKVRKFYLEKVGMPRSLVYRLMFYKVFPKARGKALFDALVNIFLYRYYEKVGEQQFLLETSIVKHPAGKRK